MREDSSIFMGSSCSLSPSSCAPGRRLPSQTDIPGKTREQTGSTLPCPHWLESSTTSLTEAAEIRRSSGAFSYAFSYARAVLLIESGLQDWYGTFTLKQFVDFPLKNAVNAKACLVV